MNFRIVLDLEMSPDAMPTAWALLPPLQDEITNDRNYRHSQVPEWLSDQSVELRAVQEEGNLTQLR